MKAIILTYNLPRQRLIHKFSNLNTQKLSFKYQKPEKILKYSRIVLSIY